MLPEWPFAGCRDALPVVFTIPLLTQVIPPVQARRRPGRHHRAVSCSMTISGSRPRKPRGTRQARSPVVAEATSRGHVVVRLDGEKLRTGRTVEEIAGQG